MKKIFFTVVVLFLLSIQNTKAQGTLYAGLNFQMPIESTRVFSRAGIGAEASYMYEIMETFDLGFSGGYSFFKARSGEAVQFFPISATASFLASEDFSIITDLGYAVGVNQGNKGGYYYRPKLNYFVNDYLNLNIFYSGITKFEGSTWTSVGVGVSYTFNKD